MEGTAAAAVEVSTGELTPSLTETDENDMKVNMFDSELLERVDILEDGVKTCRGRLDAFSSEVKILLVEINIVCDWIKDRFGVKLFDKNAQFFKHIHDYDEIEELSSALSLFNKKSSGKSTRSARQPIKYKSEEEEDEEDDDEDDEDEEDDDDEEDAPGAGDNDDSEDYVIEPPECVIQEQDSGGEEMEGRGRRRATRKRINYSELAEGIRRKKVKKSSNGTPSNKKAAKGRKQRKPYKWRTKEEREKRKQEKLIPKKRGRPKKKPEERAVPNKEQGPMMCEECGKILKGPGSLKSHMDMHADRRPFPCPMEGCGKRFRVKNKLAIHMIIHKGEKTEQCRFCGRLFYFQKDLARHERTHTGEKPHGCPMCPKSFNVKQHLTLHIRTHTGERPYKCPTCEKTFSQANSLRIHKKIHLKVKGQVTANRKPRGPTKNKIVLVTGVLPNPIAGTSSQSQSSPLNSIGQGSERSTPILVTGHMTPTTSSQSLAQQVRLHHVASGGQDQQHQQSTRIILHSASGEVITMDPVQQAWKLSDGGIQTVQFPIYGFETPQQQQPQQQRHGIIQNPTLEQRMFPPPQFTMSDPNIRYFTGE